MNSVELSKQVSIEVKVRLIGKGNDETMAGNAISVTPYDKDGVNDDFLEGSMPDEEGLAKFVISKSDFSGTLNVDDKPDFYFMV
ncbi:MAG: hypothetical protein ABI237_15755 [Ginsengibacter sp.]